jgi:Sulfotransferase domain
VIGFPKSGTTSITRALESSGLKCAHWQNGSRHFVGALIYSAMMAGEDPFARLQGYDAITQADVCLPAMNLNFWPNLDFAVLNAVRRAHPQCLFLLNYRRPEAICASIEKWKGMHRRFQVSDIPGLPRPFGAEREHLMHWIENHFHACRTYFADDERFLEIDIERADAPDLMSRALGIPITGWGDFKPDPPP